MIYAYTDVVNGVLVTHTVSIADADVVALTNNDLDAYAKTDPAKRQAALAAYIGSAFPMWLAHSADQQTLAQLDASRGAFLATPRYLGPGATPIADENGGIIAIRGDGAVFRNGIRLGGAMTQKALLYGDGLYMKGKTVPTWWSWTGSAWVELKGELDPAIFT
jgi:hypothetical protein